MANVAFKPPSDAIVEDVAPSKPVAFKPPSDAIVEDVTSNKNEQITTSGLGSFSAAAAEGVGIARGALLGAKAAMSVTPRSLPYVGVLAKPIAGVVGGVGGGILASVGITSLEQFADTVFGTNIVATRKAQQEQHPTLSRAGSLAGMSLNPWLRPMLPKTVKEGAAMGAVGVGLGAGMRAIEGQPVLDPKELAIDAVTGAFVGPTARGRTALGLPKEQVKPTKEVEDTKSKSNESKVVDDKNKAAFVNKLKEEKAKVDATIPLVKTAIRHKETGVVTELGAKHPEDLKKATADTHDQGFIDANGTFLERKEAWNRAKTAGQIPEGQTPERPTEGLHSGDLRKAGDENFKLANIPTEIDGIPIVQGSTKKTRADGRPIGATTRRNKDGSPKEVVVDTGVLYDQFAEKPWTKPQVEGVLPIAADAFKTPQEWIDFVIEHEHQHTLTPKYEGQTKASYENQTNNAALEALTKKKASEKSASVVDASEVPKRSIETPPSTDPTLDRTKTSPRDVASEQEMFEIASEIYAKHGENEAVKFYEGFREYQKTWLEPIKETEKFVGTNLNSKEANERIIHNNTSDLKEMAGKDVNLEKLSFDIDKGETLVGKAKEIADKFRQLMNDLGKRALEKGVINGWHEDYVARNVVTEGTAPPGALEQFLKDAFGYGEVASEGGTKTTTKYGEQRKLKTREDLTIHLDGINKWLADNGKDYRFKLKTDNLADIYKDYALSVEKAIENKNLIENIKQIRNENGESLVKPIAAGENLPYGWKTMDNAALAGYAIHQDLVPHLKFVFDSTPNDLMKAFGSVSQFVKRMNVVGSFLHAKSLMEVQSSANIPIWSPIKEAIVLPLIEKGVKAVTGKDIQLSAITKAVDKFREGGVGTSVDKWIREDGLQLGVPEDVSQGILTATGKLADTLIGKYGPKTRVLEKSLSTVEKYTLGYFDKYTWDYLHTGIKLSTAEAYLDKARMQASKEGKPFDEAVQRKEIAKYLNEAAGGLNWYQAALDSRTEFGKRVALAAYSPEGRRALQTILFAPDWTVSTVRAFSSALPKDLNPTTWHPVEGIKGLAVPTTKGDYARLYQFKTALTYFTLLNAINMMTANRPIWENKDPTRIEFPDGTSMQAMKHAMEPYHWISDPDKTLSNKLGFIPKAAIIGIGGLEYASPNAPKLVDRSALSRLGAAAKSIAPFQAQAAMDAPKGEGVKRALLGTAGFPIYGADADTRKAQRAERELATKEQAWNYRDKEIKAGRMDWTPKHDKEKERLDKRREKLEQSK